MPLSPEFWVRTKWLRVDLEGKTVQFTLAEPTRTVHGYGIFRVVESDTGMQHIDIVLTTAPSPWELTDHIVTLQQHQADRIEPHPEQIVAPFRMLA
jgi:hypothetical protein